MTVKQFNDTYPDYNGLIYVNSGYFIDDKMKMILDSLNIEYKEIHINSLDTNLLKQFKVDIGPNLFKFKNGMLVASLQSLVNRDSVKEFAEKEF